MEALGRRERVPAGFTVLLSVAAASAKSDALHHKLFLPFIFVFEITLDSYYINRIENNTLVGLHELLKATPTVVTHCSNLSIISGSRSSMGHETPSQSKPNQKERWILAGVAVWAVGTALAKVFIRVCSEGCGVHAVSLHIDFMFRVQV